MKNESWLGLVVLLASSALVFGTGCGSGNGSPKTDASTKDTSTPGDVRADADSGTGEDAIADLQSVPDAVTPVRLQLSETAVRVTEGSPTASMGTFTVSFTRPWSSPITVSLFSANPNVATVIPETLTFAAGEIGPQMVTVLAAIDDDTVDNTTTITLSSVETGGATLSVEVDDMDVQGLLTMPGRLAMTEGRTESLNVRLAKRPASAVVVTLTSSNPAKLTVGTGTLTFNASNYSIPQTVSLVAAQDDDAALDNVTVNLTATGNIPPQPVPVEITDDDAVNLDVTPPNIGLMERSTTPGVVSVSLTRPPASNVTVSVTSANTAKATVSPAMLTFTPTNSATPQMVQVLPVSDDDSRDEMVNLTFVAAGITPVPPPRTVAVAIDDPDSQALQVMPAMVSVAEGATTTFDVRLTLNPGSPVTVNVFSQNPAKVEVSPPVLSFNSSNFNTPQTVTVRSLQDDDLTNDSITVTLTGSAAENVNVPVAVTDDDMQSIQLIPSSPAATLLMQETQLNGPASTSPLGVRLAFRPASTVTVLLTSGDQSKLTLSRSSVTFSPADYSIAQFVTLTAPHDVDMVDDTVELSATAAAPTTGIPLAKLPVEIRDMDVQNFDISAVTPATVTEGRAADEGSATFTLKLTVVPENPITPEISVSTPGGKATVSSGCTLTGAAAMTTGCTVTVTAVEDDDARDEAVTVRIADPANAIAARTVNVAIDDQDAQGLVVVAANPVTVTEQAGAANARSFTVQLLSDPVVPVTVNLTASLPGQVTLSDTSLTLTTESPLPTGGRAWNTPQVITVTGIDDQDLLEQNLSIRVSAPTLGVPDAFVNVRKTDDDIQALVLTQCSGSTPDSEPAVPIVLTEGGSPASMCVRLRYQPDVTNTVTLTASQMPVPLGQPGPNFSLSDTTLTFDSTSGGATSYNTPRLVTITPAEDENLDSEGESWDGKITISVTPFANPRTLKVNVNDNDQQGILLGMPTMPNMETVPTTVVRTLSLNERTQVSTIMGSESWTMRLYKIPQKLQAGDTGSSETITVTPSSAKVTVTGACSGAPAPFTFTNATSSMSQTLTITACPDADDSRNEMVTLTLHSDRPNTPDRQITVTVVDLDEPFNLGVTVVGSGGTVSAPADLNNANGIAACGAGPSGDCSGVYEPMAVVTLTETHDDATWEFSGWGGDCPDSDSATMNVTMNAAHSCTATFRPRLAVTVTGQGRVDSTPSGIGNCRASGGSNCTHVFSTTNQMVQLDADADSDWSFAGWSGATCSTSTSTPLALTMNTAHACTARFNPMMTVTIAGTGSGTVTGSGFSCATGNTGTCSVALDLNSMVTLTAAPTDSNSVFAGWTGSNCTPPVTMSAPRNCTATFNAVPTP